ncbi:hypothetical protein K0U91_05635 [Chryseobacterium chendengshani]|uniref:hypothetical protein n=1 Tax=Chryseobacterium sp. LJ668 TaxID=2864040 RepID=UPI001C68BC8E|nr:hypothetical protein [Chryseobacterium sp. LJ668]MBW8521950.1 hypothetical protein [Chryseobacterium sp. LJ668]QYK17605.1 hypothetical protein K0U91_05635 [Chryseobacterium sp. LJ668]
MNILPVQNYEFDLIDSQTETLDRLKRKTETPDNLTSKITGKSFIGQVNQNKFNLRPSNIDKSTFCTLQGVLHVTKGEVKVEINKTFKVFLYFFLCLPFLGFFVQFFSAQERFSPVFILVCIGQILVIRYFFIGIFFRISSKIAVAKLLEVLDAEKIRKK